MVVDRKKHPEEAPGAMKLRQHHEEVYLPNAGMDLDQLISAPGLWLRECILSSQMLIESRQSILLSFQD